MRSRTRQATRDWGGTWAISTPNCRLVIRLDCDGIGAAVAPLGKGRAAARKFRRRKMGPLGSCGRLANSAAESTALTYVEAVCRANGRSCDRCGARDRTGRPLGTAARHAPQRRSAGRRCLSIAADAVFEASRAPIHKWLQTLYLVQCATRSVRARPLARIVGVSPRTATAMLRRLQESGTPTGKTCARQPACTAGRVRRKDATRRAARD
jgi:hypothetical protein